MVSTLESIALIDSQAIISEFLISEILLSDKPDVLKLKYYTWKYLINCRKNKF